MRPSGQASLDASEDGVHHGHRTHDDESRDQHLHPPRACPGLGTALAIVHRNGTTSARNRRDSASAASFSETRASVMR